MRHTSIYTADNSYTGQLLREAAKTMPLVRVGERGWILKVIQRALLYWIENHKK